MMANLRLCDVCDFAEIQESIDPIGMRFYVVYLACQRCGFRSPSHIRRYYRDTERDLPRAALTGRGSVTFCGVVLPSAPAITSRRYS